MVSRVTILAGACILIAALWAAQEVLKPLALGVLLTFLLAPLVARLEHWHFPRAAAVISVVVLAFGALGILGWVVGNQLFTLAGDLPKYRDNITQKMASLRGPGGSVIQDAVNLAEDIGEELERTPTTREVDAATTQPAEPLEEQSPGATARVIEGRTASPPPNLPSPFAMLSPGAFAEAFNQALRSGEPIPVRVEPKPVEGVQLLQQYGASIAAPLGTLAIVIVLVIFMLLARQDLRDRIIRLLGRGQLHVTTTALDDAASRISRYLLAQAIVNGSYGLTVGLGLWLIGKLLGGDQGFPNWALWGLLCAVIRFIPYVGPWIGASIPILLAAIIFPGPGVFFATIGFFVVLEIFSNNVMEPWLYGASTGLSETAVIVSAIFWTWLWGPLGLVLATPITACLVVLGKYVPQLQFLDILLGDEPGLDPPARVYQRLLALDQEEAMELVHGFHKEMSLEQVYEEVLLPALAMCEQDRHAGRLDHERQSFVHTAMRSLIDEMADQARLKSVRDQAQRSVEVARGQRDNADDPTVRLDCKVLCLPSSDVADEIVGLMLSQLLEARGYQANTLSNEALAAEMLQRVDNENPDIVVVSALPPSATTRARYLCKRLHQRAEQRKMIVGLWTVTGDLKAARERLTCVASVQVVTTLATAMDQVRQMTENARVSKPNSAVALGEPVSSASSIEGE